MRVIILVTTFAVAALCAGAEAIPGACSGTFKPFSPGAGDWNGWGADFVNSRYQPQPGLSAADVPKLKVKWALGFRGDLRNSSQPVVVGGRVFIGGYSGQVYSLDPATGCTYWIYDAGAYVRGAVNVVRVTGGPANQKSAPRWIAFFGDGHAFAHAVDAESGVQLWKTKMDDYALARITGSPVYYGGRVYVPVASGEELASTQRNFECCKFRGSVAALDASTGRIIWKTYSIPDPPKAYKTNSEGVAMWGPAGVGIWSAPTIDKRRKRLYVGTGNSYSGIDVPTSDAILALDLESGSLLWSSQLEPRDNWVPGCPKSATCPDNPGQDSDIGASPVIRTVGGKEYLIVSQKSGVIYGLDLEGHGRVIWKTRIGVGGSRFGGIVWGPAVDGHRAYVATGGPVPSPQIGMIAIQLNSGQRAWSTFPGTDPVEISPGAVTAMPGAVFAGFLNGRLRAYASRNGEMLWDFDALRDFETVNGVPAKGGSFNGGGVAIAHGMVFATSGYGFAGQKPGNVILAFSIDGK
jgi:polyvinyl alcohol dehydrogenase (cytochrome)